MEPSGLCVGKKSNLSRTDINLNAQAKFIMNPKTIKTLSVLFVGLVLIILELNWLDKSAGNQNSIQADFNLERINEAATEKIIITGGGAKKEIVKAGEKWSLGGKPVADSEIKNFFAELKNAAVLEIASKNKSNQQNFGLAEKEAYVLEIIGGKGAQKILIGKAGAKGESFYAKKDGSDTVYLIAGSLRAKIIQSEESWLEKKTTEVTNETKKSE